MHYTFTLFTVHVAIPINPDNLYLRFNISEDYFIGCQMGRAKKLQTEGKVKYYWIKEIFLSLQWLSLQFFFCVGSSSRGRSCIYHLKIDRLA
jgi:hypothetical protein